MSDFFFELFLQVTRGQFGKLGNLDMIYWLKATTYSFLGKGTKGTIICRDNSNSVLAPLELNVSLAEAEMIAELFRTIGFPGRSLDVQKVADTSDCWTAFSLQVYLDDKQDTLSLGLQCSGFEGEDTSFHLLDQIKHAWTDHSIVGVSHGHEDEIRLVGEGVASALLWPHVVNLAEVVVAQPRCDRDHEVDRQKVVWG